MAGGGLVVAGGDDTAPREAAGRALSPVALSVGGPVDGPLWGRVLPPGDDGADAPPARQAAHRPALAWVNCSGTRRRARRGPRRHVGNGVAELLAAATGVAVGHQAAPR